MYLAHRSEDGKREQTILKHLVNVAGRAEKFARPFGAESWANAVGSLHDIGKYSGKFQRRIRGENVQVDHSTAGAQVAKNMLNNPLLAYCIAGHHGGLPDGGSRAATPDEATLSARMVRPLEDYEAYREEMTIPKLENPTTKLYEGMFSKAFFTRMLYSCLVDADFLDTEKFMCDGECDRGGGPDLQTLYKRLTEATADWRGAGAPTGESADKGAQLNAYRSEILNACFEKGNRARGLYTLSVPTGGGKTISSLAFALQHAVTHGLERVIYVIPYSSIIEQTAEEFRKRLGAEAVLEHHSNVDYDMLDLDEQEKKKASLATENWDKPVMVTTSVQFFDSLFSNKSSKCRKLHNIANSVLIFDEAQMLPTEYLKPCVRAIAELVHGYGCTAVLCTATQPSLQELFPPQLPCEELCPDLEKMQRAFRRTTLENAGILTRMELTDRMARAEQVLCIVNSKKQAQEIYKLLPAEGKYHLSTAMTPVHRKAMLALLRERLAEGKTCRVVSTSLVEAGVDLDFEQVYRELAGLDSIIQAAGRCNRHAKRAAEDSPVYTFEFAQDDQCAHALALNQPIKMTKLVMKGGMPLDAPESIEEYFNRLHYIKGDGLDQHRILEMLEKSPVMGIPFAEIGKTFRLLEDNTRQLFIPLGQEAEDILLRLRAGERNRPLLRRAAQYSVQVYDNDFELLQGAGVIEMLDTELSVLRDVSLYSQELGLMKNVERGDALLF